MWKHDTLVEIVGLLERDELYLFTGAGFSKLAGYPLWDELLIDFANEYGKIDGPYRVDAEEHKELLRLARQKRPILITRLSMLGTEGSKRYVKVLQEHFLPEKHKEVHESVLRLPFAGYITMNYDRCLESAWKQANGRDPAGDEWLCFPVHEKAKHKNISEIMMRVRNGKFILHMHGCVYHEEWFDAKNIILTPAEYSEHYGNGYADGLQHIFDNILNQHLLILGTSLSDPYFLDRFLEGRNPLDVNKVGRRKRAYIVFHEEEKGRERSPRMDKEVLDLEHIYYAGDKEVGLKELILELERAYEASKRSVAKP
jgi:hypothetical protein